MLVLLLVRNFESSHAQSRNTRATYDFSADQDLAVASAAQISAKSRFGDNKRRFPEGSGSIYFYALYMSYMIITMTHICQSFSA